jgi:hypothetical protein
MNRLVCKKRPRKPHHKNGCINSQIANLRWMNSAVMVGRACNYNGELPAIASALVPSCSSGTLASERVTTYKHTQNRGNWRTCTYPLPLATRELHRAINFCPETGVISKHHSDCRPLFLFNNTKMNARFVAHCSYMKGKGRVAVFAAQVKAFFLIRTPAC